MISVEKIRRIPNKVKRNFLQIPPVQILAQATYRKRLKRYVSRIPKISLEDSIIVETLLQEGAFISSLEALSISSTSRLQAGIKKLLPELRALPPTKGERAIIVPRDRLMDYPEIFLWGLEERILDTIENYLCLPVLYHGTEMRREIANGMTSDVRQWHFDVEDQRMLKIIIYLNDVGLEGGPFEYISKSSSSSLPKTYKISGGFISDQTMKNFVPTSDWNPCVGSVGTVIFADTCNVLHRAKPPLASDRFSLTFSYTSKYPIKTYGKITFSRKALSVISNKLSKRQRDCLLGVSNLPA